MKPIESVWLFVDANAPAGDALATAVEVARRSGAELTNIGAIGRTEDRMFETSFGEKLLQLVRKDREARILALEASARSSLPRGRIRSILLEGDVPWHSVAAHAGGQGPDLLVVAARGGTGTGFDPVSQHLFRKCAVPVWSVHPGRGGFPRRALAAVYPGPAKSDERRLARRVIEVARRIAGAGPLELHVATAWTVFPGEELLLPRIGEASTQAYVDSLRENARREMEELLAEAEMGAAAEVHLPKGDPASAIPALAERLDADLVLLGSAGRTRLAGLFIGSTAEEIISHLARSVLVVKPPGFVSPVRPSKHDRATLVSTPG
jgi:nucleotide-binding universal stress UspA family protein